MGLLSYVKPSKAKKEEPAHAAPEVSEKEENAVAPAATPGTATPGWSRPASIAPADQYRNSQSDLHEIKCDVMVNWLYQQQMERLWTAGGVDEGVVLKKNRSEYTCCPGDMIDEPYGFFKAVETLNVRVSPSTTSNSFHD